MSHSQAVSVETGDIEGVSLELISRPQPDQGGAQHKALLVVAVIHSHHPTIRQEGKAGDVGQLLIPRRLFQVHCGLQLQTGGL